MNQEFQNGVAKTKEVLTGATAAVADSAKEGTTRMSKWMQIAMSALPGASERMFEMMLARAGLARRSSGIAGVGLFIGGFAAGSIATAFTTPVSGPELRKRVFGLVSGLVKDAEPVVKEAAEKASDLKDAAQASAGDLKDGAQARASELKEAVQARAPHTDGKKAHGAS